MPKCLVIEVNDEPEKPESFYLDYAFNWGVEDDWDGEEGEQEGVKFRRAQATLEELADFCDREAEGRNNHAYVGTHRILAAVLHQKVGRSQATALMQEIAEYGGLDGMRGAGGEESAFADFGIKRCWADWSLPEEGINNE